jgi:hypothetical protein
MIIATTGLRFLQIRKQTHIDVLRNNGQVRVLVAKPRSQYLRDVRDMESSPSRRRADLGTEIEMAPDMGHTTGGRQAGGELIRSEQLDEKRASGFIDHVGITRDHDLMARMTTIARRWREQLAAAQQTMDERTTRPGVLIEVAAQHPLVAAKFPGNEFSARLRRGRELYLDAAEKGPATIYVPGSRHVFQGVEDAVSLSEAGGEFLKALGVPAADIRGDDLNATYTEEGVYGSIDECYVTARYFLEGEFGQLFCVVSSFQLTRKMLHYVGFGVLPLAVTAPTRVAYHDLVDELFLGVPDTLFEAEPDHARQVLMARHGDRRPGPS